MSWGWRSRASQVSELEDGEGLAQRREEDWVEAEIERLLLNPDFDGVGERDSEQNTPSRPFFDQPSDSKGLQEDLCVGNLYSCYVTSLSSQQSGVETLLSDAYATLITANDSPVKIPNDKATTEGHVCGEIDFNLHNEANHESVQNDEPACMSVSDEHDNGVGQPDDYVGNNVGKSEESILDASILTDILNVKVQTVLNELEEEQKRLEEELTNEQKERETEITSQIEFTQKLIVEDQEAEIERVVHLNHVRYKAAMTLQSYWKSYSVQKIYRDKLLHLKQLRLQRQYRAAQLLQAIWRGFSVRRVYGHILVAKRVLRIERMKRESIKKYQCAVHIQAYWRGFKVRCIYGPVLSSLREKRLFKALLLKEEQDKLFNKMAMHIQAMWRGYLVRKEYRSMLMKRMVEWQLEKNRERHISATKLQACWRGFSCRQKTRKWLLEQKMQKRIFEEQQARAAQAQVLGSGKLTVTRRLQSALILKSLSTSDVREVSSSVTDIESKPGLLNNEIPADHQRCEGLNMTVSEREGISLDNCKMTQEEHSISPLIISRGQEEDVAHQCKVKMSHVLTYCDAEKPILEKQSYHSEISHALPPQIWVGVVQDRLQQWALSMTPWNEPNTPSRNQFKSLPKFRGQQSLKSLSSVELLAASPSDTPLDKVTCVVMRGSDKVPDVSCLSCCPQLCTLDISHCGLSILATLPSTLPLAALNAKCNILEQINLQSVGASLKFLNISENKLCSIHGLDLCSNLLHLNVSGNKITRLGGLSGCCNLEVLSAENNLLVSCSAPEVLPFLQKLSCASNHLPNPPNVHICALLTNLQLQQNNLQEAPRLSHHVVLRELRLEENNLTNISSVCQAWLPLLQTLSVAGNCITQLDSLIPLVMLQSLDISNNSICDLPMLLQALRGCMELSEINVHGNPVNEEPQINSHFLSILPTLRLMNGKLVLQQTEEKRCELPSIVTSNAVFNLCKRQISEQDDLRKKQTATINSLQIAAEQNPQGVQLLMDVKVEHCKQFKCLLVKHVREQEKLAMQSLPDGPKQQNTHTQVSSQPLITQYGEKLTSAVLVLQSIWRGRLARRSAAAKLHAVIKIQALFRGMLARQKVKLMLKEKRNIIRAATIIQAVYRGYWVRCKLREVIQEAKYESEEDSSLEEDIDLNWRKDEFSDECDFPLRPLTPNSFIETHKLPSVTESSENQWAKRQQQQQPQSAFPHQTTFTKHSSPPHPLLALDMTNEGSKLPMEAWNEMEGASSNFHSLQCETNLSQKRVTKTNYIDEWGIKTDTTVHLLMKRAKRQKNIMHRAAQRKKMKDPTERLAAFQKHSDAATYVSRERKNSLSKCGQQTTYKWFYDHKVIHKDSLSCDVADESLEKERVSRVLSECSLPQLGERVLAGHPPALVARDCLDIELSSKKIE